MPFLKTTIQDKKSEHVMLVDLARNDLSRNGHGKGGKNTGSTVLLSHVIHLVSKVSGYFEKRQPCKW
jgi:anthranilate synthase component 1